LLILNTDRISLLSFDIQDIKEEPRKIHKPDTNFLVSKQHAQSESGKTNN